jgi:flagellin
MALYIQTNVASMVAQTNLGKTQNAIQTNFSRLSSGYRINSAADDAAGLGISESLTAQIRSFGVAERNANDGISMAQTADGAAAQIGGILTRMRELGVQSMNGSLQSSDRSNLDTEYQALLSEVDRIADVTKFNGTSLLSGAAATVNFQVGINTGTNDQIGVVFGAVKASDLTISGSSVTSDSNAKTAVDSLDAAISKLSTKRTTFGTAINRLQSTVANIQSMKTNLSAANSRIRDVDVAEETASLARQQVLSQAGSSILAQANQAPQLALSLLRG